MKIVRYRNKTYILVGAFELQYGHVTRSLSLWHHRRYESRLYCLKRERIQWRRRAW